jgi:riboflavin synthase
MFTGLVQATGTLSGTTVSGAGARLVLTTPKWDLTLGESIAVDGVCLTVAALGVSGFEADVSRETLERTTLGSLGIGANLNLERSLAVGDRLGGHWVTGHVDTVAVVASITRLDRSVAVEITLDPGLLYLVAEKGSVALNGVSLTVNGVSKRSFGVMLIPHTLEATNLKALLPGTRLNLEVDVLARYVARWQSAPEALRKAYAEDPGNTGASRGDSTTLLAALRKAGFTHD